MAFVILRRSTLRFRPLGFGAGSSGSISPLRRRQIARIGKLVHPTTILHTFSDRFLGLVLNVMVLWNTIYIEAALEQLRQNSQKKLDFCWR